MADKSTFSRLVQAGIVVRDANKAVERLSSLGMGTFVGKPEPPWVKPVSSFRDKPFLGSTKPPLGSVMGDVELELIQPLEGESPWQEFLDKRGEGIHHIAFKVDDLDKEVDKLTKHGLSVMITGSWQGGGFAYFDLGVGGLIVELVQGWLFDKNRIVKEEKRAIADSAFSRLIHISVVVRDVDKVSKRLSSLGMGTFVSKPEPPWVKPISSFRGKPFLGSTTPPLGSVMGDVELELIQPLEGESPWQEFLDKHGEGIHHIAFKVDDLDKEVDKLTKRGLSVMITGTWPEGGFAYFDLGVGGLVIELEQGGYLL